MSVVGVEQSCLEFCIIFLDITHHSILKQRIAVVHLYTKRVEGIDYFGGIGDNSLFAVRKFG